MIEAEWWEYDSVDEMADAVAGDIGFIVESAIEARNEALLALPGGETPKPIFAKLAATKLPWKRVTIIPGDERLVPVARLANLVALAFEHQAQEFPVVVVVVGDENAVGHRREVHLSSFGGEHAELAQALGV